MIHINRFVDKIKFFESNNSKDFIISMHEAKNLHADITKLLLTLHEYQSIVSKQLQEETPTDGINGGDW
jgi:hypothetical protein